MSEHASVPHDRVLSPDLAMDAVTLRVGDLELMSDYYADSIGLTPIEERSVGGQTRRVLGRGGAPLVRLVHTPDLPSVDPQEAGLFHTAFLFDAPEALAAAVYRSANVAGSRFVGSSDHLVSEAFYFTDPEGNGIELYVDRPRAQWHYEGGELRMDTIFLDPNTYLRHHLSESALVSIEDQPARVGHVHLQVGDIAAANEFYVGTLGFEITLQRYPGALFASAGGYHHHLAMNTWNSRGAGPRAARLGLGDVAVTLPGREHLDAAAARLRERGVRFADAGDAIRVEDPWGTQVTLALPQRTVEQMLAPDA